MPDEPSTPLPHTASDHELMRRVGEGDRDALGLLVERHQAKVVALAYRFLGRWDAAEDVAQDVFVRVWRAAAQFRPEARFTTWLYRLAVNLCWDRRRQAARELRLLTAAPPPETGNASSVNMESRERVARVRRAVGELPDRQRLAVILHRYEGLSHREIAEATGWSQGAVESCLVRAYEKLRQSLSDMGPG
ncbi:MAG: sigma-70 family RNA polymerase sigma factor [Phycisphaerae bacterium]|jgi:RNA polymerase sigma-70 factor (ECF subfamily)